MAQQIDLRTITLFDGSNYLQWKFQISLVMKMNDIFTVVDGTLKKPSKDTDAWDKKDISGQTLIASTVNSSQLALIMNCHTANEMWTKLEEVHSNKGEFAKQLLLARYYSYAASPGQSAVSVLLEIEQLIASLRELGESISDSNAVARVVSALPNDLKPFKSSWDSVSPKQQTMDYLMQRLKKVDAEMQLVQAPMAESSNNAFMVEVNESSESELDFW